MTSDFDGFGDGVIPRSGSFNQMKSPRSFAESMPNALLKSFNLGRGKYH